MVKTKTATKTKAAGQLGVAKKAAKKPQGISRAQEHQYFVLVDGRRLGDIKELADALEDMADHVWNHHVTTERNDFATWVRDVFTDEDLAQRLRAATGKHHAQIVLYRTILERI